MDLGTPNYSNINKGRSKYFNYSGPEYDKERKLLSSFIIEGINTFGMCCEFYIATYDTKFDPIFGEDGNRRFERSFDIMSYTKQPLENKIWTKDGIVLIDNFSLWSSKKHFKDASMVGNNLEYFPPKMGDVLRTNFNNSFYEITEVVESDTTYLQSRQFAWEFIVKPFKDELIKTSDNTKDSSIANYTNKAKDIFDITNTVDLKAEKTMYRPKLGEKAQKNPWQTTGNSTDMDNVIIVNSNILVDENGNYIKA